MQGILNLRQFIELLRKEGELIEVSYPVNPHLELAEIHRRVIAADGPALLFTQVKGSAFPVVTNLFGSTRRVDLAFHNRPENMVADLVRLMTRDFPPRPKQLWKNRHTIKSLLRLGTKRRRTAPITEKVLSPPNLEALPLITSWPLDGGPFLTLPLVYTESPEGGPGNLGMYRMQRYDDRTMGLHCQIAKGGGFHLAQAEALNQPLPVTVFLGGPPALMLSAITPLPENVPELMLAALLQGKKLDVVKRPELPHPLIAQAEFALVGEAPPKVRQPEGPFGDHYGYYSWKHDFPIFRCNKIFHRSGAIYPATVVGKPRQEDFYIGNYLQKLLSPLFPVVMPGAKAIWSYGETGFHSLGAAVVHERYYRECMATAFRILGEGQLALTKFLLLTDQSIDLEDFPKVLTTVLERFRPETDLFIFANLSLDTLDYTGPALNKGSRGVLVGVGEKVRDLPRQFQGSLPQPIRAATLFCPGCLVIEAPPYQEFTEPEAITRHADFADWPLLILVDIAQKATRDVASFLWTVFTRFEPAADIYAGNTTIHRHHLCYSGPILIDARMKPSYPPEVACDEKTAQQVTAHWHDYFPAGMKMGNSDVAHVV